MLLHNHNYHSAFFSCSPAFCLHKIMIRDLYVKLIPITRPGSLRPALSFLLPYNKKKAVYNSGPLLVLCCTVRSLSPSDMDATTGKRTIFFCPELHTISNTSVWKDFSGLNTLSILISVSSGRSFVISRNCFKVYILRNISFYLFVMKLSM